MKYGRINLAGEADSEDRGQQLESEKRFQFKAGSPQEKKTMGPWNHHICNSCYAKKYPGRIPNRMIKNLTVTVRCCFCGADNKDAIGVREEPGSQELKCGGRHEAAPPIGGTE